MIETLIVTGAHNHDWKRSAPFIKRILEDTGRFRADITENPSETLGNQETIGRYQLLFLDYRGPFWSEEAKTNFVEAVRGGAWVTVLHGTNNAFSGWVEFEEMCGICWRAGSAHGKYHRFDVKIVDRDHPVTRGVPDLKDHPDELYHGLVHMHEVPYRVLATAYSDPGTLGTGRDEPMIVVREYGKGRIYHNILGHVWENGEMSSLEDPQFQNILIRGCEWAATGEASQ